MLTRMIKGHATQEGTERYALRFGTLAESGHFRQPQGAPIAEELRFSSLGIGTYLGEPDQASDQLYSQSIATALKAGINVVDTAINYRHQRSERSIGRAIAELVERRELQRDEVIVCSKAGYLSFDATVPNDPVAYFTHEYLDKGIFKREDVSGQMHCMSPSFLEDQLDRSRRNLGLETIDVYYIHNPEAQRADLQEDVFYARLKNAFASLEKAVTAGKIQFYGIASWNAFRVPQSAAPFISLEQCAKLAHEIAGAKHHLRFVQLPFNLAMPEAYAASVQPCSLERCGREMTSLLEAAARHGIAVIGSASLYQSQLTSNLPEALAQKIGLRNDTERALQFARSAPGLLTALVGMGKPAHVSENLRLASGRMMPAEEWKALFAK